MRPPVTRTPALALLLLGAMVPVACSSPATTGVPTATPPFDASAAPTGAGPQPTNLPVVTPEPTIEAIPTSPGQSQTAWGPIWNTVPDSFPVPIDAEEADAPQGPVSGAWLVPKADVSAIALAGFYRDALIENGWLANVDGPLEDGSYTIASMAAGGCRTLTTIAPRGSEHLVTVLFGASCLFQ